MELQERAEKRVSCINKCEVLPASNYSQINLFESMFRGFTNYPQDASKSRLAICVEFIHNKYSNCCNISEHINPNIIEDMELRCTFQAIGPLEAKEFFEEKYGKDPNVYYE